MWWIIGAINCWIYAVILEFGCHWLDLNVMPVKHLKSAASQKSNLFWCNLLRKWYILLANAHLFFIHTYHAWSTVVWLGCGPRNLTIGDVNKSGDCLCLILAYVIFFGIISRSLLLNESFRWFDLQF
jgi:hypothetical protein